MATNYLICETCKSHEVELIDVSPEGKMVVACARCGSVGQGVVVTERDRREARGN